MGPAAARAVQRALVAPHVKVSHATTIDVAEDEVTISATDGDWRLSFIEIAGSGIIRFFGHKLTAQGKPLYSEPRLFTPSLGLDPEWVAEQLERAVAGGRGTLPGEVVELMTDAAGVLR